MLKLKKSVGIVFLVLLAFVLAPAAGWSQEYDFKQQSKQSEVSVDEIVSFAKAQDKIADIRQNYQAKLSDVKDQEQQQSVVQEMNEKLVDAVQKAGLSVEQYNKIFNATQSDPALQQRVSEVMQNM
jgi:uncharacterized protein YlxW (UPF0749 family)